MGRMIWGLVRLMIFLSIVFFIVGAVGGLDGIGQAPSSVIDTSNTSFNFSSGLNTSVGVSNMTVERVRGETVYLRNSSSGDVSSVSLVGVSVVPKGGSDCVSRVRASFEEYISSEVVGKRVVVLEIGTQEFVAFSSGDSTFLTTGFVRRGLAVYSGEGSFMSDSIREAQESARMSGRGIWSCSVTG